MSGGRRPQRIVATYRLQLRNGVRFAEAQEILPYLKQLGVSHLYLSPIFKARSGSTHGYDIVDPTEIDPVLGGESGFRALAETAHAHGLGMLLDIVPNHLGVGHENPWWQDLLRRGQAGFGAHVFDVDWESLTGGTPGKVLLPILGDPINQVLDRGELVIEPGPPASLRYFDHSLPLADDDTSGDLAAILERQHWRLSWWKSGQETLNWRRFFDITDLAGIRTEDEAVFERSHVTVLKLLREGLIDGLRLDHVDGLADPGGYLARLDTAWRDVRRNEPWVLIEKIVGPDETLPADWPTAGTTGYETLNQILRLFVDKDGIASLNRTYAEFGGDPDGFESIVHRSKRSVLETSLRAELDRLVMRLTRVCDIPPSRLRTGLIDTIVGFPYYRTYGEIHRPLLRAAFHRLADHDAAQALEQALRPGSQLLTSFEQLSGPAMAKSLEDTAFYRWHRLIGLNEVGGEPDQPYAALTDFHTAMTARARDNPLALTSTATHDTKRGEDTRLRIACLSHCAEAWHSAVIHWRDLIGDTTPVPQPVLYFILQTMVGIWPADRLGLPDMAARLEAYAIKAMREAKEETSWLEPNTEFETQLSSLVKSLCTNAPLIVEIERFMEQLAPLADHASLAQTMLKLTLPGIPDIYQGSEAGDYSLVDPDNRRPIDFGTMAEFDPCADKQQLVRRLLQLRQDHHALFALGRYEAMEAHPHCVAFARKWHGSTISILVSLKSDAQLPICPPDALVFKCGQVSTE